MTRNDSYRTSVEYSAVPGRTLVIPATEKTEPTTLRDVPPQRPPKRKVTTRKN